jgi:hypothetical protein
MMELKKIIREAAPDYVLNVYRRLRRSLATAKLAAPVVQIYINDGDIETIAGFNNFVSFLAASVKTSGKLRITLWNSDGGLLLLETTSMDHFESRFVDIKSLLVNKGKQSDFGMISLLFVPDNLRSETYKKLGLLASHFFMFYRGSKGAVAMVHPTSTLDYGSPPSGQFITNQVLDTVGLEGVTLYQCNPSQSSHAMTLGLQDAETQGVVCSQTVILPPMGVRKLSFSIDPAIAENIKTLRVFTSSLPSASKPMLCRRYSGGRFSMSHS